MTIELVGEVQGDLTTEDNQVSTSRILTYLVTAGETVLEVYNAPGMPPLGAPHPENPNLQRGDISIKKLTPGPQRRKYEVTLPYSTPPGLEDTDPGASTEEVEPWKRPPFNFSLDAVDNIVPFDQAYYLKGNPESQPVDVLGSPSNPVVASSGTPLGASKNESNLVLRFSYYLQEVDPDWTIDYRGSINSESMTVASVPIPEREGLLRTLKSTALRQYDGEGEIKYEFYRIDVEIELDKAQGIREVANESLFLIDTDQSPKRIYQNAKGVGGVKGYGTKKVLEDAGKADEVTYPVAGQPNNYLQDISPVDQTIPLKLADGSISIDANGKFQVEYKSFQEKFPISWGALDLPESITAKNFSTRSGLL